MLTPPFRSLKCYARHTLRARRIAPVCNQDGERAPGLRLLFARKGRHRTKGQNSKRRFRVTCRVDARQAILLLFIEKKIRFLIDVPRKDADARATFRTLGNSGYSNTTSVRVDRFSHATRRTHMGTMFRHKRALRSAAGVRDAISNSIFNHFRGAIRSSNHYLIKAT